MTQKLKQFLSLFTFVFLLNGCSSTMLVESWSDKTYQGPKLKKILVIGVIKKENRRRSFENEFVKLITNNARTAIASHTVLGNLEKNANKESVLAAIEKTGADGVIIVTTRGIVQQQRITPVSVDYIPNAGGGAGYGGYGGMYDYYNASHSYVFNQGNTVSENILKVDTKLFNAATEKMLWSGKTESLNPKSATRLIAEYKRRVIRDIRKNGFID